MPRVNSCVVETDDIIIINHSFGGDGVHVSVETVGIVIINYTSGGDGMC